jgi:hypothetical protein
MYTIYKHMPFYIHVEYSHHIQFCLCLQNKISRIVYRSLEETVLSRKPPDYGVVPGLNIKILMENIKQLSSTSGMSFM